MAVDAYIPNFTIVTITAAIDSINPCAIGVLILMLSILLGKKKSTLQMLGLGLTYIFAVFLTYLIAGFGLLYFLSAIPLYITEYIAITVGALVIGAGVLEIKDYFWYAKGLTLSIPPRISKHLPKIGEKTTFLGVTFMGAFVAAVELPCTGAPYLAIITLLSQNFDIVAFWLLVWYNLIFVSPLIVILALVVSGKSLTKIHAWKDRSKGYMRLAIGVMLVMLGWLLILIANGTINFT